jgi:hypothetical protein
MAECNGFTAVKSARMASLHPDLSDLRRMILELEKFTPARPDSASVIDSASVERREI